VKLFSSLAISGSGLTAEKLRLDVTAANIANMETTRTPEGGPYRRKTVIFSEMLQERSAAPRGVEVRAIVDSRAEPRMAFDPEHPDANAEGYVAYPDIDLGREMAAMITALRSYEANVTALNTAKSLYLKALEIGRG
jgi:flagellar basal-body rod protein FlgC